MAKARQYLTSVTWVWVRDIYPVILDFCGSPQYCGPWLAEQIAAGRVRWRTKATRPPNESLGDFWQGSPPSIDFMRCTVTKMVVAPPGTVVGLVDVTLLGFEVVREDIEAFGAPKHAQNRATLNRMPGIQDSLIPPPLMDEPAERGQPAATESTDSASVGGTATNPSQPVTVFSAKSWITNEVYRMKAAGEIIASPTALAEELAIRMKKAARIDPSIRPVSQRYIRAQLYEWGLITPRRRRR
jgi:hypothetical protein